MPLERRARQSLQILFGFAVSALFIWLAFRGRDFGAVWRAIRTVHLLPLVGAVTIATLAFPLRVPRWRLLLRQRDDQPIPFTSLWHAIAIGFAANNVIPLRTGEVLRAAAVTRLAPVSFAAAASSIAVERVLDALTVITLLGIGLIAGDLPTSGGIASTAEKIGILCLAALLLAIVASWRREEALRWFERLLPKGPVAVRIVGFVDNLLRGLSAMRDPKRALPVIGWSFVVWLFTACSFYLAFRAFGFPLSFHAALVVQGAVMIGIAAPSAPSGAGPFEAAAILGLALYGIDSDTALACAVTYHVTTFLPITLLGLGSALRTGVRLRGAPTGAK